MNRRDIIKYTAMVSGAAISAPLLSSLFTACHQKQSMNTRYNSLFSAMENKFLISLIDTILPSTDSPSASEVGVHVTIDQMVHLVYTPEQQKSYRSKFELLFHFLNKGPLSFLEKSVEERLQDLRNIDHENDAEVHSALTEIKQQTIAYYLSTEEIGKNFLNYLPVPGPYQGCITLEQTSLKSWTL